MACSIAVSVASANLLNSLSFMSWPTIMFSSPIVRTIALTLILAGCGTKGPLTMPPRQSAQPPAVKPMPAPVVPQDTNKAGQQ
ncbi:lipoprotein [Methyloversatilis sp.]|uniref:LPS translocon maturation chaperone LptM n=1 Tax=Methyloversatilis sp. TaxID=2569862 RepID=UPI0035B14808